MKTQEIAAAHAIYRTRDKYQNNQLKKENAVAAGLEETSGDGKGLLFLSQIS